MSRLVTRSRLAVGFVLAWTLVVLWAMPVTTTDSGRLLAAQPADEAAYVGTSKCAPCHFAQFQQWKLDSHAKAFEILPAKYKQDAGCLKCHTTGYGTPSGYQGESTPGLAGTTCEACHGPGSDHVSIAQRLAEAEVDAAGEQQLRDSIQKVRSDNACVHCHLNKRTRAPIRNMTKIRDAARCRGGFIPRTSSPAGSGRITTDER